MVFFFKESASPEYYPLLPPLSPQGALPGLSRAGRHRADCEGHFRGRGELAEQLADAPEVAAAHLVAYEGVVRVQHGGIVAPGGLQRLEPRMYVLGRKLGFKAFEAAGPGIHTFG